MSLERPLAFRRMQLQLMTPAKLQGHLDCFYANLVNVPQQTGVPICPNFVTAIDEVRARLAAGNSHYDPVLMEQARQAVRAEYSHLKDDEFAQRHEPRVLESKVQEAYFWLVAGDAEFECDSEIQRLSRKACLENQADRTRWEETAQREADARAALLTKKADEA